MAAERQRDERENVGHPQVGCDKTTADVYLRLGLVDYTFDPFTAFELGTLLHQAAKAVAPTAIQ